MMKLSVIIVLYNEYELVKTTLASIYKDKIDNMEVILIDNSPINKGHESVLKLFPKVIYYHSKENNGFGSGVNEGIKKSKGNYVLVLTPDMYILKNTIKETMSYIQKHPKVGMVGCHVFSSPDTLEPSVLSTYPNLLTQLYYYNMLFYKLVHRFVKNYQPMYLSAQEHTKKQHPKAISGQYILMRKKALVQVKNFDTRFFMYFEDIDLCKRLIEHGWSIVYLPIGGVVQNGITSWKKTSITQAHPVYMESNYKFFYKHYGRSFTIIALITGAFSASISLPYLIGVSGIKKFFHKSSQANDLLPLWVEITKWHFTKGIKLILSNNR